MLKLIQFFLNPYVFFTFSIPFVVYLSTNYQILSLILYNYNSNIVSFLVLVLIAIYHFQFLHWLIESKNLNYQEFKDKYPITNSFKYFLIYTILFLVLYFLICTCLGIFEVGGNVTSNNFLSDYFHINSPIDDTSQSTPNSNPKSTNPLFNVSQDSNNYNFSINKDVANQAMSKLMEYGKGLTDNLGTHIPTAIGASAGAKVASTIIQHSASMPVPAKIVTGVTTVALTALATSGAAHMAEGAAQNTMSFAQGQIANSAFNRAGDRAPSPSNDFSPVASSPADNVDWISFTYSSDTTPLEMLLQSILLFQFLILFISFYLVLIFIMQSIAFRYASDINSFIDTKLSFLPAKLNSGLSKVFNHMMLLHKTFYIYFGLFLIVILFFCIIVSMFATVELLTHTYEYCVVYMSKKGL